VGSDDDRLSEGDGSLSGSDDGSLDHQEVLIDDSIVGESSHGGNLLLRQIKLGGSVVGVLLSNSVDLLGDLSSVVESVLSSSRNSERDSGRMPRSDTGNLSKSLVGLSGQLLGSPSGSDSSESVSLGDSNGIDHLVLVENGVDGDLLLEQLVSEINLLGNRSSVNLDLHDVGLLLSGEDLVDLSVSNNSDDGGVLLEGSQSVVVVLGVLGQSLGKTSEGLSLGLVPLLVESSSEVISQMVGPDGADGLETVGGGSVSTDSNDNNRRGLNDGDLLNDLLLVDLGTGLVDLSDDVSASSLVSHEGSQVGWLGLVILGERADFSSEVSGSLSGQESERSVSGGSKLSVRH